MKPLLVSVGALVSTAAFAQAAVDTLERLRSCSALPNPQRLECLERLSRELDQPPSTSAVAPRGKAAADWVVSETTSPVDYSPVAVATATSVAMDGAPLQLSIQCRGGRTDLVIASPMLTRRAEEYAVSYSANDGLPVSLPVAAAPSGSALAAKTDVMRLLNGLPAQGAFALRITARNGAVLEGRYALDSLRAVAERLARPCQWAASTRGSAPENRNRTR
jgi:hypothetical protein